MPDRMRGPAGFRHSAGKLAASRPLRPNWRTLFASGAVMPVVWPLSLKRVAATALVGLATLVPHIEAHAEDKVIKHFSNGTSRDFVGMIDAREDAPADGPQAIYAAEDGSVYLLDQINGRVLRFDAKKSR